MNFPENLKYTADHEWIKVEGDTALVGITDYAQKELGDIVFVDVTSEGETLSAGEVFGNIEAVKTVSELLLPAAGEVLELNPALADNPALGAGRAVRQPGPPSARRCAWPVPPRLPPRCRPSVRASFCPRTGYRTAAPAPAARRPPKTG